MILRYASLAVGLALSGCSLFRSTPPATPAHYTVGSSYQLDGVWYYPQELTQYDATGLATVAAGRKGQASGGQTADGETFDASALAAAHQTLQLPAIARVTNLENGRQVLVRLNDRGPANPARLIALTRHAADLLGAADGTRVRVQLEEEMTRTLADQLGGGLKVAVASAPRGSVQAETLAPPPGTALSSRAVRVGRPAQEVDTAAMVAWVPDRLPDAVVQGTPDPGQVYLRASEFGRIDYAQRMAAQLAGLNPVVERVRGGRTESYRVRAGPFRSVANADAAMAQARNAGIADSHLVVE